MTKVSKVLLIALGISLTLGLVLGCQQAKVAEEKKPVAKKEVVPTRDNPLVVDTKGKKVMVYTEVNAKYFTEPTRHGVVFKDGSNSDKSVLRAYANQLDFYDALIKIGAAPGNNVKLDSPAGTAVQGDELKVTVKWDNKVYDFAEIIKSEPDQGFTVKFGGNQQASKEKMTGCILCLDTCAVGITSNSTWGWQSFSNGKVKFFGRESKLPGDGAAVIVTFSKK